MPNSFFQGKEFTVQVLRDLIKVNTILDVGPGVGTYYDLLTRSEIPFRRMDAVEVWEPYVEKYELRKRYSSVHVADIREWENFNYDLVIFGDVLEHMSPEEGRAVWEKVAASAKYAVISIPIFHAPQGHLEDNPYETHVKDDWTMEDILENFSHIRWYKKGTHIGVAIADFSYDGTPHAHFEWNTPFVPNEGVHGGTEIMIERWREEVLPHLPKLQDYRCFVIPGQIPAQSILMDGTPTVVWCHLNMDQLPEEAIPVLTNPYFKQSVKVWIAVSEWHKKQIMHQLLLPEEKVVVIPNAIDPLNCDLSRFENVEKVQLIHVSAPNRGMEMLIPAVHAIPEDYIELKVFNTFNPDTEPIPEEARPVVFDERITYYGKTPHRTVLKYMEQAHIHAYPTYWEETSCISQMEALSAGCVCVYSDLGALSETSMGYGVKVPLTEDEHHNIESYARTLRASIIAVKEGLWQPGKQMQAVNRKYSWDNFRENWIRVHDLHL